MDSRILLVDDEKPLVQMARWKLERCGFGVFSAPNGQDALKIIHQEAIDLIISDVVMPVMDGREFCLALRSSPQTAKIPVIISTAYSNEENTFRKMGITQFLFKPFSPHSMVEKIREVLEYPRMNRMPLRILVHTDNPDLLDKEANAVRAHVWNLDVQTGKNENEVLNKAQGDAYDLILINILPQRDAIKKLIHKIAGASRAKILLYANFNENEKLDVLMFRSYVKECLGAGADRYVDRLTKTTFLLAVYEYYCPSTLN